MPNAKLCSVPECGKPHLARGYCTAHYKRWKRNGDPNIALRPANGTVKQWIDDIAIVHASDDCLFWPFQPDRYGRAVIRLDGRRQYAARVVCALAHGVPPTPKHEAAHGCGNGHLGCVNPKHLRWATHKQNMNDTDEHGTRARGERLPQSKLTEADVKEIRALAGSVTQDALSARFGVNRSAISMVINRKKWAWLD